MSYLFIAIILLAIWIAALISLIRRTDIADTDKIIWTIVLCTLNLLAVALYVIFGPSSTENRVLSEQELKDKFNRGT